jgi:hypothetical protein
MKTEQYIQYGFIIICSIYIFVTYFRSCKEAEEVMAGHRFTLGKIERVHHIGTSGYLDYSYTANDMTYARTISCRCYSSCEDNIELCKNKRFWVAYSTKDFAHSLINIGLEMQDIENPEPPTSLDYFR